MNVDYGYFLAQRFQRPGFKIVMGSDAAREDSVEPLPKWNLKDLPGFSSFWLHDLVKRLGFKPSLWSICLALVAGDLGHEVTDQEWAWLNDTRTGLSDARRWLYSLEKAEA